MTEGKMKKEEIIQAVEAAVAERGCFIVDVTVNAMNDVEIVIEKEDGMLRSGTGNGTLTYTLTGPGFFAFNTAAFDIRCNEAETLIVHRVEASLSCIVVVGARVNYAVCCGKIMRQK